MPPKRIVSKIVKDLNPIVENYFDTLFRFLPMYVKQVHKSSMHGPMVAKTDAYSYMGVFYNFLIRKEIYNLMGEEAIDRQACTTLKMLLDYYKVPRAMYDLPSDPESESENDDEKEHHVDTGELQEPVPNGTENESKGDGTNGCLYDAEQKPVLRDTENESEEDDEGEMCPVDLETVHELAKSYQKFRNPENATIDITEDIFNTATLNRLFYGDSGQSFDPDLLNMNNVEDVLKHVVSFDRRDILLNPIVGCEYFFGEANIIMHDALLQINTSVQPFRVKLPKYRKHMYQLLFYALGYFLRVGKEIRKFKIYNPLLGLEYSYEIPHLDFNEFRELLEKVKPL